MKNLLFLLSLVLFLTSCASVKLSDLQPSQKNEKLLPALEPQIDMESLEHVYSTERSTISNVNANNETVNISSFSNDPGMQDVITLFDRDVKNNICENGKDFNGYIVCKIPAGIIKDFSQGWIYLSTLTFFIPNFLGVPITNYKTAVDVEVEIYNNSNKLIATYDAQGYYKAWVAFYYGYNASSASRISNINAFKNAMNNIKKQIEKDSDILAEKLKK